MRTICKSMVSSEVVVRANTFSIEIERDLRQFDFALYVVELFVGDVFIDFIVRSSLVLSLFPGLEFGCSSAIGSKLDGFTTLPVSGHDCLHSHGCCLNCWLIFEGFLRLWYLQRCLSEIFLDHEIGLFLPC